MGSRLTWSAGDSTSQGAKLVADPNGWLLRDGQRYSVVSSGGSGGVGYDQLNIVDTTEGAILASISAQYADAIPGYAKPTFEYLRRTSHAAQYFDPSNAEISPDDLAWALSTARDVVEAVESLLASDPPELFSAA